MNNKMEDKTLKPAAKRALVPILRFPEFQETGEWDQCYGNDLFEQVNNRNPDPDLPVLAITQEHGAIPRDAINYHVSVTGKSIASYKVVQVGDFIISLRSFQGGIEYSQYHGICSPAYVILRRLTEGADIYFKHYLKTERFIRLLTKNLEGLRDGKMISYKQFSELLVPVPNPAEQQKIADCLSSFDELITLEAEKLDTLKTHKKGLMQQLFSAEGETQPKRRFPEFQEAEEWLQWKFGNLVAKSFYGTSKPTSDTGRYPVLRMGNMSDGGINCLNLVYINLDRDEFEAIRLKDGDILLNRTNSHDLVGKISLFDIDTECTAASYIVVFRMDTNHIHPPFCNFLLNTHLYQTAIKVLATKAVSQANINPTSFREQIKIFIPSVREQQKIADCFSSLEDLIIAQTQKIDTLKTYKKGLMQRLFPALDEVSV